MSVRVHFEVDPPQGVDAESIARWAHAALVHGGRAHWNVDVVLADEALVTRLHAQLFDDPTPTDVVTVDLTGDDPDPAGDAPVGEVFVSLTRAQEVAARRGVSLAREIGLYVVHGVLHLCGHDDHDDDARRVMRAAERDVLDALGFESDDAPHDED